MKAVIQNNESVLIASFACLGKTTFAKNHPDMAIDIESIFYIYDQEVAREDEETAKSPDLGTSNVNFPDNYIADVVKSIGKYRFIFLTLSTEILSELDKLGIEYTILYPTKERRSQIVEDSRERGNREDFVTMIAGMLSDNTHHDRFKRTLSYKAFEYLDEGAYIEDYLQERYEYEK